VGARDSVAYTSVKHGIVGFTRSVAYDYGPHNIRANAICPGAIQTRISPEPGDELYHRQVSKDFSSDVSACRERSPWLPSSSRPNAAILCDRRRHSGGWRLDGDVGSIVQTRRIKLTFPDTGEIGGRRPARLRSAPHV